MKEQQTCKEMHSLPHKELSAAGEIPGKERQFLTMIRFANERSDKVNHRSVVRVLCLVLMLGIGAMPVAGYQCEPLKRASEGCKCCSKEKSCCAKPNKQNSPTPQPLATNGPGQVIHLGMFVYPANTIADLGSGHFSIKLAPDRSAHSPPTCALLCTFLI